MIETQAQKNQMNLFVQSVASEVINLIRQNESTVKILARAGVMFSHETGRLGNLMGINTDE